MNGRSEKMMEGGMNGEEMMKGLSHIEIEQYLDEYLKIQKSFRPK